MEEEKRIRDALDLGSLDLPDSPQIVKLDWDYYEDSSGDEGIEIHVVLNANTTDKEIETGPIHVIKGRIVDSLRKHQVSLFPYFTFVREDEYETSREQS